MLETQGGGQVGIFLLKTHFQGKVCLKVLVVLPLYNSATEGLSP